MKEQCFLILRSLWSSRGHRYINSVPLCNKAEHVLWQNRCTQSLVSSQRWEWPNLSGAFCVLTEIMIWEPSLNGWIRVNQVNDGLTFQAVRTAGTESGECEGEWSVEKQEKGSFDWSMEREGFVIKQKRIHFVSVWFWTHYASALCPSFLIYKMG